MWKSVWHFQANSNLVCLEIFIVQAIWASGHWKHRPPSAPVMNTETFKARASCLKLPLMLAEHWNIHTSRQFWLTRSGWGFTVCWCLSLTLILMYIFHFFPFCPALFSHANIYGAENKIRAGRWTCLSSLAQLRVTVRRHFTKPCAHARSTPCHEHNPMLAWLHQSSGVEQLWQHFNGRMSQCCSRTKAGHRATSPLSSY